MPVSLLDFIVEVTKDKKSLIDIGCGYGENCWNIKNRLPHLRIVGIDICEKFIKSAQKHCKNVEFKVADARKLPYKDNEFDLAFTHGLLIHVPHKDINKTLKGIMKIAKMGIFIESSGNEIKGSMPYDPKEYWEGRARRAEASEIDKNTQYYYSHNYQQVVDKLGFKLNILLDFNDNNKTRIYLIRK